ncbi:MAG: hypothetical protein LBF72_01715 [Holosporales bacterium]|jgi:hypothetical protein|nr:hypothetical protein [Holosporales bacterium]
MSGHSSVSRTQSWPGNSTKGFDIGELPRSQSSPRLAPELEIPGPEPESDELELVFPTLEMLRNDGPSYIQAALRLLEDGDVDAVTIELAAALSTGAYKAYRTLFGFLAVKIEDGTALGERIYEALRQHFVEFDYFVGQPEEVFRLLATFDRRSGRLGELIAEARRRSPEAFASAARA